MCVWKRKLIKSHRYRSNYINNVTTIIVWPHQLNISHWSHLRLALTWIRNLTQHNLLLQVQDKFLLTLSDEEAAKEMQGLLDTSVSALMPAIAETFHRFAQVCMLLLETLHTQQFSSRSPPELYSHPGSVCLVSPFPANTLVSTQ